MKDSTCFYVTDPASYDLKSECVAVGHSWSASACASTGFARRCTQKTKVSIDNGPEQEASYVYLYPPGNTTLCLGTEEKL